jgi:hypothetical protein
VLANHTIYNTPMLEQGRKRHPLSILVLCSVGHMDQCDK